MKKIFSILFSLAIILSGVHITVSAHYCGGKIAASEISLSGKTASCGMEEEKNPCSMPQSRLSANCCHDVVSVFCLYNNYKPSVSSVPESFPNNFQNFNNLAGITVSILPAVKSVYTNISPPGVLISTSVDLSEICIFRI